MRKPNHHANLMKEMDKVKHHQNRANDIIARMGETKVPDKKTKAKKVIQKKPRNRKAKGSDI